MKKIVLLGIFLLGSSMFAGETTTRTSISLGETPTQNRNYSLEQQLTYGEKEHYEYYDKYGVESPQFESLSPLGKTGIIFSSWFVEPETFKHIKIKDNSNLEEKLDSAK
jgi:hypothetical protein